MRSRTRALLAAVVAVAPLLPTTPAEASPFQIVALARKTFVPVEVVILPGSGLTFTNLDIERHDVTSRDLGENGAPLFRTDSIAPGGQAAVVGVETLPQGAWPFWCLVHTEMVGNVNVQ